MLNARTESWSDIAHLERVKVVHAAQGEGGSGFFKVWRLLLKDMSVTAEMHIDFIDDENFRSKVVIPKSDF